MENQSSNQYYVEVAPGGPWLGQDGLVKLEFKDRGLWDSPEKAKEALDKALKPVD